MPVTALVVASIALIAMTTLNMQIALLYFAILLGSFVLFRLNNNRTANAA